MRRNSVLSAILLALSGCAPGPSKQAERPKLGLNTSLPIYWAEADDFTDLIGDTSAPHRVRAALETDYALVLVDEFSDAQTAGKPTDRLSALEYLILAQPAALPPADLVAIDAWVRGGGKLLVFADPMLTEESAFAFGDRRRPQDIVMLGPLLTRWGLALSTADSIDPGTHRLAGGEGAITRLAGRFSEVDTDVNSTACTISSDRFLAECRIGNGTAVLFADAAMLEGEPVGEPQMAQAALQAFLTLAFGAR